MRPGYRECPAISDSRIPAHPVLTYRASSWPSWCQLCPARHLVSFPTQYMEVECIYYFPAFCSEVSASSPNARRTHVTTTPLISSDEKQQQYCILRQGN